MMKFEILILDNEFNIIYHFYLARKTWKSAENCAKNACAACKETDKADYTWKLIKMEG